MTVQSQLRVYNTLTRKQESFKPVRDGRVNLFVCGLTVYDVSHIDHPKTYVAYDILPSYLRRKSQKPGEIAWDSPWGMGRPGWHIEDTAMTVTYVGTTYDIHGGGTDLIFPHHEAEIAQAEGLTGKEPLAKYWLHTGLLNVQGQEMHKTLKNTVPIQESIGKVGVDALRVFYASTHYRSPVDYTEEALVQASSLARRFRRAYDLLVLASARPPKIREDEEVLRKDLEDTRAEFFLAMNDDFNTPGALTAYIKIVGLAEKLGENPGKVGLEVRRSLEELGSI